MLTDVADGDCGSWVFDKKAGVVYGHVVSGHPSTGTAYIVPLAQIFQNIQHRIGNPVELFAHTSNKLWGCVSENSDSTMRATIVHDFDAPRLRGRLSNAYAHGDRFPSETPGPSQLSETESPAPPAPAQAPVIPRPTFVSSSIRTRVEPELETSYPGTRLNSSAISRWSDDSGYGSISSRNSTASSVSAPSYGRDGYRVPVTDPEGEPDLQVTSPSPDTDMFAVVARYGGYDRVYSVTRNGVSVINHRKKTMDPSEPRSSDAMHYYGSPSYKR